MEKIVITGGGTGGHAIPCLAVGEYLKNDYEVHYIGSENGIESKLVKNYPFIKFHIVTTCKFIRSFSLKNLLIPLKLLKGIIESKKILKDISPIAVFSKGGYVSVPVVYSANKLKIPVISHESDLSLGLANKINLTKSKYMCCSFLDTANKIKVKGVYTGSPIRNQIFTGNKNFIIRKYRIINKNPTILVLGGSMGSKNLNSIVRKNLSKITEYYNIIHICGMGNIETINIKNYYQTEFADNIQDYYDMADMVISRAGSNVLFELLSLKKPMLLIPLEKGSRGDQVENAEYFVKYGYAKMIREGEIKDNLYDIIDKFYSEKDRLIANMKNENTDAIKKISSLIKSLTQYS